MFLKKSTIKTTGPNSFQLICEFGKKKNSMKKIVNRSPYFGWMNQHRGKLTEMFVASEDYQGGPIRQNKVAAYAGKIWKEMSPDTKRQLIQEYKTEKIGEEPADLLLPVEDGSLMSPVHIKMEEPVDEPMPAQQSETRKKSRGPYKKKTKIERNC